MRRSLVLAFSLAAAPALADAPKVAPAPAEPRAVQKFGVDHPDCIDWTDGCVICTQKSCSTPGIACTPGEPVCTAQAAPPEAPKTEAPETEAPKTEAPKTEAPKDEPSPASPKPAEPPPVASPAQKP
jgi:hypothetical protein